MTEPNAILAISSLDRFTNNQVVLVEDPPGSGNFVPERRPVLLDTALYQLYRGFQPGGVGAFQRGDNFVIESTNAMLYGYIKTIGVSQVQIDYHIPTVIPGTNDLLKMVFYINGVQYERDIQIPFGFYTPDELAAILTVLIREEGDNGAAFFPDFQVTYLEAGLLAPTPGELFPYFIGEGNGFLFDTNDDGNQNRRFGFLQLLPNPLGGPPAAYTQEELAQILATYKLLGITWDTFGNIVGTQGKKRILTKSPNLLYTHYIDICSTQLTKYQKVKDSDSSPLKRDSILARVYLTGIGSPQATSGTSALGSLPFILTVDLNTAKIIRWDRDEAIYSLDFQLYDMYGKPIFWTPEYPTEFQMTLMCSEGAE